MNSGLDRTTDFTGPKQILFAAIVLGISLSFMKAQQVGSSPVTTRYSVFVGDLGCVLSFPAPDTYIYMLTTPARIIAGALGLAAHWITAIPRLVPLAADGAAALFALAGGVAWALGLRRASCTAASLAALYSNPLLNQGCQATGHPPDARQGPYCYVAGDQPQALWPLANLWPRPLKGACQKAYANVSFQFLGGVVGLGLVVLGFVAWRKQGARRKP